MYLQLSCFLVLMADTLLIYMRMENVDDNGRSVSAFII